MQNPRRCLVVCIVRCVSCWHVLTSARQTLHSTKCHPYDLCQMQAPSYGDKFFCFLDFINCHSSVHGYGIAFSCFKVCQQPVWHGIKCTKPSPIAFAFGKSYCLVCCVYLRDYWTVVLQEWVKGNNSLRNWSIILIDPVVGNEWVSQTRHLTRMYLWGHLKDSGLK